MKKVLASFFLKALFYPAPKIMITKEEEHQFNDLYTEALNKPEKLIDYQLPIPKYKFLYYIAMNKPIVLHGSNHPFIKTFEPREQTLYNGKQSKAVFATKDPIWPVFYAILQKEKIVGNIRNGALFSNNKNTYHFYSLTKDTLLNNPWTKGMVYILPEDSFVYIGDGAIQFKEWISNQPVSPLAKIEVQPSDFYFINKVSIHQPKESILKSWLLYKSRTSKKLND